ncbi:hypothetical protein E4U61_005230 [Claviceps capensis]|nr:hypothetical protein E4U61_005230 [Claviceps capensis]
MAGTQGAASAMSAQSPSRDRLGSGIERPHRGLKGNEADGNTRWLGLGEGEDDCKRMLLMSGAHGVVDVCPTLKT